jgi:hypothetical protein
MEALGCYDGIRLASILLDLEMLLECGRFTLLKKFNENWIVQEDQAMVAPILQDVVREPSENWHIKF